MKQTAVEFLVSNLNIVWEEKIIDLVEQAKEMEKQQIIDAYYGYELYLDREFRFQQGGQAKILTFDQWYETYGSKGSDETKEYPYSHIYETMNGKYGLSSYDEHDQTDGIFDTYQEAVDFGLSLINNPKSSQIEISDEEIEKEAKQTYREHPNNPKEQPNWTYGKDVNFARKQKAFINGAKWYREQLKKKQ